MCWKWRLVPSSDGVKARQTASNQPEKRATKFPDLLRTQSSLEVIKIFLFSEQPLRRCKFHKLNNDLRSVVEGVFVF